MKDNTMGDQQVEDFELGWLAGIIDGEGYLGITVQNRAKSEKSVKSEIQIVNTDYEIVNKIVGVLKKLGINPYIRMRTYKTSSWNDAWNITIGKLSAIILVLSAVADYMTGVKGEKAKIMCQLCKQRIPKGRSRYDQDDWDLIERFKSLTPTTIPQGSSTQVGAKRTAWITG